MVVIFFLLLVEIALITDISLNSHWEKVCYADDFPILFKQFSSTHSVLELIVICTTSFQHQDFPEDPSGRFDDFDHFVNSNFDTCKWIGWLLVLAQGCSVLLAAVLRATEKDQGRKYGNEDDNAPQRLPFLGYPVQPFPCAIVDFPLALQQ
ncbi:hypothetical protein C3L33_06239, partial [Rhododendron williamsianum]